MRLSYGDTPDAAITDPPQVPDPTGPTLPPSERLNVAALAGLFRHTTNSNMFVFFLTLLELLRRHRFDSDRLYTYAEITVEMLATAWFAHSFFKLSFGTQDTIAKKLDALDLDLGDRPMVVAGDCAGLRQALAGCDLGHAAQLLEYVPYRVLGPFLAAELRGVERNTGRALEYAMPAMANAYLAAACLLDSIQTDARRSPRDGTERNGGASGLQTQRA